MTIKELETLGFYEPGLLHLRVNTDFDIKDLNKVLKEDRAVFSTFLHEYIHFLQDVTTTNGLTYSTFYISLIKDVNNNIINDDKAEFTIPFDLNNNFNILTQMQLRSIYMGSPTVVTYARYDMYQASEVEVLDNQGNVLRPKQYTVYYHDTKGLRHSFMLGTTCIKEYVAHTLQEKFYGSVSHPDIPYLIVELIIDAEYPVLKTNVDYVIALCDACLMVYHPAEMFFNTLERMKKQAFAPKSIQDVYDFTYNELTFKGHGKVYTLTDLYLETLNTTVKEFENTLQADVFSSNLEWIKYIFNQGQLLRLNNRGFITGVVGNDGNLTPLFYEIFHALGTPYFTNKKSIGGIVPPRGLRVNPDQPYQLLAFKQILSIYQGNIPCTLHDFCSNNDGEQLTDELCLSAPWERGNKPQLCPFGQLWKTWALNGQIPVPK